MSVFSYDESVADDAKGQLTSVTNQLQGNLDDLSGFVKRVQANWTGDVDSYNSIQQEWDKSAAVVQQILTAVETALGETTSSVRDMRGKVRGALQG
jgi:uncharacterized protein YukE